jgi:hypothetical protein
MKTSLSDHLRIIDNIWIGGLDLDAWLTILGLLRVDRHLRTGFHLARLLRLCALALDASMTPFWSAWKACPSWVVQSICWHMLSTTWGKLIRYCMLGLKPACLAALRLSKICRIEIIYILTHPDS